MNYAQRQHMLSVRKRFQIQAERLQDDIDYMPAQGESGLDDEITRRQFDLERTRKFIDATVVPEVKRGPKQTRLF